LIVCRPGLFHALQAAEHARVGPLPHEDHGGRRDVGDTVVSAFVDSDGSRMTNQLNARAKKLNGSFWPEAIPQVTKNSHVLTTASETSRHRVHRD
jgi:hypothetical protein